MCPGTTCCCHIASSANVRDYIGTSQANEDYWKEPNAPEIPNGWRKPRHGKHARNR